MVWRSIVIIILSIVMITPSAFAVPASSRVYDGTNDEVDWGNNLDVTTNDASWCIWANPVETAAADFWLGKKSTRSATDIGYDVSQNASDQHDCIVSDGTTQQVASGSDLDGVWTFVCCVWDSDGDDLTIYENGVNIASDTVGTVGTLSNAVNLTSGESDGNAADANGNACFGSIFLSKELTAVEIQELMWKPEGMADSVSFVAPIMGDATEPEWVAKLSGTVSGTDASNGSGPPVMFGLGLPL